MWLQAHVAETDLTALLAQLLPAAIRLGDDGELTLGDPSAATFVAGVGLCVVCRAKLRWKVLGIHVPITVESIAVVVRPEIVPAPGGPRLVFGVQLQHADVVGLPRILDDRVTDLVNRELAARHPLSWNYASTLSHAFPLPSALQSHDQLALEVVDGRVETTSDALSLAIRFEARAHRRAG